MLPWVNLIHYKIILHLFYAILYSVFSLLLDALVIFNYLLSHKEFLCSFMLVIFLFVWIPWCIFSKVRWLKSNDSFVVLVYYNIAFQRFWTNIELHRGVQHACFPTVWSTCNFFTRAYFCKFNMCRASPEIVYFEIL